MRNMAMVTVLAIALLAAWMAPRNTQAQSPAVRPAKVVPMQNFEVEASRSGRPAFLPREWGRLVSVQRLSEEHLALFLEAENGEIHVVRLLQRGGYLYLDTTDQGGVATVLRR